MDCVEVMDGYEGGNLKIFKESLRALWKEGK